MVFLGIQLILGGGSWFRSASERRSRIHRKWKRVWKAFMTPSWNRMTSGARESLVTHTKKNCPEMSRSLILFHDFLSLSFYFLFFGGCTHSTIRDTHDQCSFGSSFKGNTLGHAEDWDSFLYDRPSCFMGSKINLKNLKKNRQFSGSHHVSSQERSQSLPQDEQDWRNHHFS